LELGGQVHLYPHTKPAARGRKITKLDAILTLP
jgi:hypothetical protein